MMKVNKNPEYFLTVAAEGSISKAAEKLYVSQPYLSQHIIRLEESFQVQLLDREKSPLQLTPAGQVYASYLESSKQMYQKLIQDFASLNVQRSQTLRLGFSNWRASALLPDILPMFTEQFPDVNLKFFEVPNSSLYRLIADDKVDLAIMNTTMTTPDYVTTETILYERIVLVGNRENAAAQALKSLQEQERPLDLHLLENERAILLHPESALASRVNNYLDKQQVTLRNFTYMDNAATALNLTAQNYGFCFLNETGIRHAPNPSELIFFDLDSNDLIHPLCIVYKKNSYLLPIARSFIDITVRFYREQYPSINKA